MSSNSKGSSEEGDQRTITKVSGENRKGDEDERSDTSNPSIGNDEEAIEWVDDGAEEEEARVELGLAGKIWTGRNINANAFMTTIKNVWQPSISATSGRICLSFNSTIGKRSIGFLMDNHGTLIDMLFHLEKSTVILTDMV